MDIIYKIKSIREQKGMSQEDIALELGISQSAYAKIESQKVKITVDKLLQIAKILEYPLSDLVCGDKSHRKHCCKETCEMFKQTVLLYEKRIEELKHQIYLLKKAPIINKRQ